jgi:hypothetical protein
MPAVIIPALIMAGASVAGAKIASNAAGKASGVQKDAEDKSLVLQKQQYDDAQARYAPYTQMGQQALPTLRSLAGNVQAPLYGTNLKDLSIYGQPPPMPSGGPAGPGMPQMGPGPMKGGSLMPAGGNLVQLQAPNNPDGTPGPVQAVKRELVQHYVQLGAKVVGGR